MPPYFYFDRVFRNALTNISGTGVVDSVVQLAGVILLACLAFSAYEAFTRGGDVRLLAISGMKYLIVGLVLLNYTNLFLGVNTMFTQVAEYISRTGPGGLDVFSQWGRDAAEFARSSPSFKQWFYALTIGTATAVLSTLLVFIGLIAYAISYALFCLLYAFYGCVLYVAGPLVLALYPALGTTPLARSFLTNLMIFNAWGLVYAILGCLMAAVNLGTLSQMLMHQDAAGFFADAGSSLLLGLASILFALCIALIPYMAKRIVQGDVGSTMFAVAGAAATAAMVAATAAMNAGVAAAGFGGGGGGGGGGGAAGGGGGGTTGGGGAAKGSSAADKSSGNPPGRPPERSDDTAKTERMGDSGQAPVAPAEPAANAETTSSAAPAAEGQGGDAQTAQSNKSEKAEQPAAAATSTEAPRAPFRQAARSSQPHWRVYRPMDVVAMASFHAGSAVGWGASKVTQALRPRSRASSGPTEDE